MTSEEAIEIIKVAQAEVEWNYPLNYAIAFDVAIEALEKQIDFRDLKNEFCYLCGKYKRSHLGACDGCRWRDK